MTQKDDLTLLLSQHTKYKETGDVVLCKCGKWFYTRKEFAVDHIVDVVSEWMDALKAQEPPRKSAFPFDIIASTEYSGCHAYPDGDCYWAECPQTRDGEPQSSGRHCPIDLRKDSDW